MSIYSRDYMRDEDNRSRALGPANWSVVIWLLVINATVYLLNNLLFFNPRRDFFGLSLEALGSWRVWTPLTYQFVHASLWHLLANMLGLFFLGRMLLDLVPPRKVLEIYLLGGLAGGALQLGWNAVFEDAIIVGASASVLAITIAVATLIPYRRIQLLLFFIIPVSLTLRQVAWLLVAINLLTLLLGFTTGGGDGVAVLAHFGGMLLGWAYVRFIGLDAPKAVKSSRRSAKGRGFGVRILREGEEPDKKSTPAKRTTFVASDVDAILDKINEHGFQSLSAEERRTLELSSEQLFPPHRPEFLSLTARAMLSASERAAKGRHKAIQRLQLLGRVGVLVLFCGAVYLSGRIGIEMARNRLPQRESVDVAVAGGGALTVDPTGDPLYLAQSPDALRRFFAAHPTPEDRASANLTGLGIRRLQDSMELTTLRAEADAVEIKVTSGAIAGAVYWIHHSQLPAPSSFDPIITPVPGGR